MNEEVAVHVREARRHLKVAGEHVDEGNKRGAKYRITLADSHLVDALGASMSSPDGAGADGQPPRSFDGRRRDARTNTRCSQHVVGFRTAESSGAGRTKVIAATDQIARDGWIVEPAGIKTANFLRSASICFNHDYAHPVATPVSASLLNGGAQLAVEIEWPPAGTSAMSDEVRSLVRTGVIRAVSIGFVPLEMEPLDPKKPWDGQRVTSTDLLELSFVAVPADTGAVITQRARTALGWSKSARAARLSALIDAAARSAEWRRRRVRLLELTVGSSRESRRARLEQLMSDAND